jgi:hypothetical protein
MLSRNKEGKPLQDVLINSSSSESFLAHIPLRGADALGMSAK